MSGLAGVFHRDGREVGDSDAEATIQAIAYRGAESPSRVTHGPFGCGATSLGTTPEAKHERLPRVAGDLVICADARVDNRETLLDRLPVDESPPLTDSDLILAAYRKWGTDCPEQIVGAFAFVIYDGTRDRLFCARDHAGIRPFYYACTADVFVFGSDPNAVLAHPAVKSELDRTWIGTFLGMEADRTGTVHEQVRRFPPANAATVTASEFRCWEYWSLTDIEQPGNDPVTAFRETFTEAVRCRLRSTGPIGATVSGGLDSSSVAWTAADIDEDHGGPLLTYSALTTAAPASDEREHVEIATDNEMFRSRRVDLDNHGLLRDLDSRVDAMGGPFDPVRTVVTPHILPVAAADGIGVLLSGYGGDTTVSFGVGRLAGLVRRGRLRKAAQETIAFADRFDYRRRSVVRRFVVAPLLPQWFRRAYFRHRYGSAVERTNPTIDDQFAGTVALDRQLESTPRSDRSARDRQVRILQDPSLQRVLEIENAVAVARGIEPRYPFFDRRLMELCVALPGRAKLHRGTSRWVLRESMRGILPEPIRQRSDKADYSPYVVTALRDHDRGRIERVFEESDALWQYVDRDAYRRTIDRLLDAGKPEDATPDERDDPGAVMDEAHTVAVTTVLGSWLMSNT